MALIRCCDICGKQIKKYIKVNAKEYGDPTITKNKKPLVNLDICEGCFGSVKECLSKNA